MISIHCLIIVENYGQFNFEKNIIYRLMHAVFHINTVIIPRDRYRPEVDMGWGMITVPIWKKACINLFITYFNIELKRTKLTSHTPNLWIWVIDIGWGFCFQKWRHGAHERLDIVLADFCTDGRYRCGTSGVYVRANLTLLLINMW